MSYVVVVTYGTREQVYASNETRKGAERLKEAALERGYSDARIEKANQFYAERNRRNRAAAA